jgi:hypothetical protein
VLGRLRLDLYGFIREFRPQMSLSFGTNEISPISMFVSLGTSQGGWDAPAGWPKRRLRTVTVSEEGHACPR